ncbi:SDR family NAD(P)-dependent oxidoreductase [Ruicaihuangia caeni]|uniref:SDR family NAD(P)-dependent oxidoreductase n=1 Tax=Ruicaihuangia caeni TaxID=3042517 RepID=A0AAW6TC46_9MICO|nr:SDR family NAD(P)-dependent oxidoreductase [Klugiella sp. YN-L-19]MDI2098925.1 SDR family NAD(P)-dependent oxidoreductase [Klugiella sp. YN-L-19]
MQREHRFAIVTGAASGIGDAVARSLAAAGRAVALLDLNRSAIERLREELASVATAPVRAFTVDLTDAAAVDTAFADLVGELGPVTELVNCAGRYVAVKEVHEITEGDWDAVVDSNLKAAFLTTKAAMPSMIAGGGGAIVNIASNAARSTATSLGAEYTAAKAGLLGLTRHTARDGARHGIRANAVAPGPVDGPRLRELEGPERLEAIREAIPLGRLADPADIAAAVRFLLSDDASFITGATLDVNGGIVMA